jgi:hypothetical protein
MKQQTLKERLAFAVLASVASISWMLALIFVPVAAA